MGARESKELNICELARACDILHERLPQVQNPRSRAWLKIRAGRLKAAIPHSVARANALYREILDAYPELLADAATTLTVPPAASSSALAVTLNPDPGQEPEASTVDRSHDVDASMPAAPDPRVPPPPGENSSGRAAAGALQDCYGAAIAYAGLGWDVLPVDPKTKRPLGGQGIKHATCDPAAIARWFKTWPSAGVGIHLAPAGLCAIDLDPRNGCTKTPDDFPPTLTAKTGGGGWHLIYRAPKDVTLPGKLGEGIDLKHHGYIIAAPSLHPSGGRYEWIDFDPLLGEPQVAEFPVELLERALAQGSTQQAAAPDGTVGEGGRNSTLSREAYRLRKQGLEGEELFEALLKVNEERCTPPLEADEVRQIARGKARIPTAEQDALEAFDDLGPSGERSALDQARRDEQKRLAERIGEGTDSVPVAEQITLDAAVGRFVFVADGQLVVDTIHPQHALAFADWAAASASSRAERVVGDRRTSVPVAQLWKSHPGRKTVISRTFRAGGPLVVHDPEGRIAVNSWCPPASA